MLGHQRVSEDFEIQARAKLVEGLDKVLAEARGIKKPGATVSAGGKRVEMIQPIIVALA